MEQIILGRVTSALSSAATRYAVLYGANIPSSNNLYAQLASSSGSLKKLRIKLDTAPGAGKSWTFTVMVNDVAKSLVVTISDTDTTGSDTAHTVTIVNGNKIALRVTSSGTPPNCYPRWSLIFDGDNSKESILPGGPATASISNTTYNQIAGGRGWSATQQYFQVIPTAGELKNLFVRLNVAPGAGDSYIFTIYVNGVDSELTCTISGAIDTGNNDTAHSIAVSAGDRVGIKCIPTGTPASITPLWGATFRASASGEFIILGEQSLNDTVTGYIPLANGTQASGTVENSGEQPIQVCKLSKFYMALDSAPGAGTSYTITVRKNNAATAITFAISASATTGNDLTHSAEFAVDDDICFQVIPDNNPDVSCAGWGILMQAPATTYPSDAITRVTSLIHRYDRGTYTLEVGLGEVTADFGLPEWESKPKPAIPEKPEIPEPYPDVIPWPEPIPPIEPPPKTQPWFPDVVPWPEEDPFAVDTTGPTPEHRGGLVGGLGSLRGGRVGLSGGGISGYRRRKLIQEAIERNERAAKRAARLGRESAGIAPPKPAFGGGIVGGISPVKKKKKPPVESYRNYFEGF